MTVINRGDPALVQSGLGGSDSSAALGLNPYCTQYQKYLEKIGEVTPPDLSDNEAVQWGTLLEDVVAKEFARRTGKRIRRNNRTLRHPKYDWMMAHLDREVVGERAILEVKTAGQYMVKDWGEEGSADVPEHYLIQCLHYLCVTGKGLCYLAVLIGGRDFRMYTIRAEDFARELEALPHALEKFWTRVQEKNPPDPSTAGDLALLHPLDTVPFVYANPMEVALVRDLVAVKATIKGMKGRQGELEFQIKKAMGNASALRDGENTLVTWRQRTSKRLDGKTLKENEPEVYRAHTRVTETRTFSVKLKEDGA